MDSPRANRDLNIGLSTGTAKAFTTEQMPLPKQPQMVTLQRKFPGHAVAKCRSLPSPMSARRLCSKSLC